MKNLLILTFFILFASSSIAQQKKDNTILIDTGLTGEEAFKSWGKHLGQNGYTIDKADANFMTISTGPKDTSKFNYDYTVNSSVDEKGKIKVTFRWRLKAMNGQFNDWDYAPGNNNVKGIIYNDFLKVIQSFGQYPVTYAKF